ncbi:phospholipid carrier-dependent glycosyltransferase [Aquella oligotrophica]|uniref:Polyprenol-phosphate-mannose--protein mannosyltransferase n=1 Tax=Aquella oligotrophica TaxID=2067065 RepID=A0A2I7N2S5_9NEIS|nr:phospholipid carrier-dependent glycosyltransferase [Aquella oligotrophica]AUR50751.1 hypothetical protein CUN60_00050 [Aquella oligotrophica]
MLFPVLFLVSLVLISLILVCYKSQKLANLNSLNSRDWLIAAGLFVLSMTINGYRLGENNHKNAIWQATELDKVLTVSFESQIEISKLYYYTGLASGKLIVKSEDQNGNISILNNPAFDAGFPPHFRWNHIEINNLQSKKIVFQALGLPIEINQIAIFDGQQNYIGKDRIKVASQNVIYNDLISENKPNSFDNTWYSSTIFDEIFYATSAYQYLHHLSPYVTVHPQLGILIIAIGIMILGTTPFGWRLMPFLFGVLTVPMVYLFARKISDNRRYALIASLLMLTDFMRFVLSRLSMIEVISGFFILLVYYLLYSYHYERLADTQSKAYQKILLLLGIALGAAIAVKWNGFYLLVPTLLVYLYTEYKAKQNAWLIIVCYLWFLIIIPLTVYCLSYIPYARIEGADNLFDFIWQCQINIYDYQVHGLHNATHPYASKWYGWPLDKLPISVYFWQANNDPTQTSSIVLMGNPIIYWVSIQTVLFFCYLWYKDEKNFKLWFLLLALLAQYLPYALVERISFIYYFYSCTPILILMLAYILEMAISSKDKSYRNTAILYLLAVVIAFIMYYPVLTGNIIPRSYTVKYLWWQHGWDF